MVPIRKENLGCYDYQAPISNRTKQEYRGCSSIEEIEKQNEFNSEFYNTDAIDKCYTKCPIECDRVIYDFDITTASYPSYWYYQNFGLGGDTMLLINVYYREMYYTLVDETPAITIDLLVAIIGGNLALFVGMSILSIIEGFEVACYLIFIFFKDKKQPHKQN